MKGVKISRPLFAVLMTWGLGSAIGYAYVDIELDGNRHVVGESYSAEGNKLVVYRPSGAVELDRTSVRSIHEGTGHMPADVQSSSVSAAADAASPPAPSGPTSSGASAHTTAKDPQARDDELAHKLMNMRLDRLAAAQRGDDTTIKKLDKQIDTFQAERQANWKKLHPKADSDKPAD